MNQARFRADNAVFVLSVGRQAKLLYLYLCRCADEYGCSFPSIANMARACSMSESSIHKVLRELTAQKVVVVDSRLRANGSQASNAYTVAVVKKGWFFAPDSLFDARISAAAKLVYLCLCRTAGADASSYPSRKRIAAMCGCGLTTLGRAIRELEEAGLIEKNSRYRENGGQSSNLYVTRTPAGQPRQARLRLIEGGKEETAAKSRNSLAEQHAFFIWTGGLSICAPLEGIPSGRTLLNRKRNNNVLSNLIPETRPP